MRVVCISILNSIDSIVTIESTIKVIILKIGELAKITGCSIQSIRFYEKEQLISASKRNQANYRLFDQKALDQLIFIKRCRNLDIKLAKIKLLLELKQSPETQCTEINNLLDEHIVDIHTRIIELNELKETLIVLRTKCHTSRSIKDCGILQDLLTNTAKGSTVSGK